MSNLILMDAARRIVRQAWLRCPDCHTFLRDNPECRTCNPYLRGETAAQFRLLHAMLDDQRGEGVIAWTLFAVCVLAVAVPLIVAQVR